MSGLWLVSYIALWALVILLGLTLAGVLRQLGALAASSREQAPAPQPTVMSTFPDLEHDGPAIGSAIPADGYDSINGFGLVAPAGRLSPSGTLIVFLSPMCEKCQGVVEPLNDLADDPVRGLYCAAIMRADAQACRAFLSVFPLHLPVVCDESRSITMGYGVHRIPFGLLYDGEGTLIRKGSIETTEDLDALLGNTAESSTAARSVFPHVA